MTEMYMCAHCGYESEEELTLMDEYYYCDDCVIACDRCGEVVLRDDLTEVDGYYYYCPTCVDEHCATCRDCDHVYTIDEMIHIDSDDVYVCEGCADYYDTCYECGYTYHRDDLHYHDDTDESYCSECYGNVRYSFLRSYHDQPDRYFRSLKSDGNRRRSFKYIGIELEMENGRRSEILEHLKEMSDNESLFHCERDGSLDSDTGVEIVLQPMTEGFFKRFDLEGLCRLCKRYGFRSHDSDNAGLHIHLSKNHFGSDERKQNRTILNMIRLLDKFRSVFLKISRRNEYSYNHYCRSYDLVNPHDSDEMERKNQHFAILSIRDSTVEYRGFKGTLKPESIRAGVEMYKGLVSLCRDYPYEVIDQMIFDQIRSYLTIGSVYLDEYLTTRLGSYTHDEYINMVLSSMVDIEKYKDYSKLEYFNQSFQSMNIIQEIVMNRYTSDHVKYSVGME